MLFRSSSVPAAEQAPGASVVPLPLSPEADFSCGTDLCRQAGRLACYEDGAEELQSVVLQSAEQLLSEHEAAETYVQMLKHDWFATVENTQLATRNDRRTFRNAREGRFAYFSSNMITAATGSLSGMLGADWNALPLGIQDGKQRDALLHKIGKTERIPKLVLGGLSFEELELFRIHYRLATEQLRARSQLAHLFAAAPAFASDLFGSGQLEELPQPLQHLAAVDIAQGQSSVLLTEQRRQAAVMPADLPMARRLSDYLAGNSIPKDIKLFLQALQVGAATMGAATCPFNEYGLCETVLQRVKLSQLPAQLLTDLVRKEEQRQQAAINRLETFSRDFGIGLYDASAREVGSGLLTAVQPTDINTKRKRSQAEEAAETPAVPEVIQPPLITNVAVRLPGGAQFEANPHDTSQFDELVSGLLHTKVIAGYMRKHNFDGMESFMRSCLQTILYPQTAEGRGIKLVVNASPVYWDQLPLRKFELAVQQTPGLQGNKTARDTRILFGLGGNGSTRHVLLLAIEQKESVKKRNLTRGNRTLG